MENTKKKCEDYKPCNIKDKDGYCMNNDRSCIWREGAIDTSDRQLTKPDVSNFVLLCKPNYKAKDGTIKRGMEINGRYYAPQNDC